MPEITHGKIAQAHLIDYSLGAILFTASIMARANVSVISQHVRMDVPNILLLNLALVREGFCNLTSSLIVATVELFLHSACRKRGVSLRCKPLQLLLLSFCCDPT